jgi:hypothetical protein
MTLLADVRPVQTDIIGFTVVRRDRATARILLEFFAGSGAFALAAAAMILFMMNTIADRVETLIVQQNVASLKLTNNLQYFDLHMPSDKSMPPGLFGDLVEFSRNTAIMMYEARRLLALEATFGRVKFDVDPRLPAGEWSDALLAHLTAKDGSGTLFNHTGVAPNSNSESIGPATIYQIRLYQSLRDYWQESCTSYKDMRDGLSTYLLPLLYALLGAALCDLRSRFGRVDGDGRQLASLGGARYATAIIAGAVVGVFTSFFPPSLSLPPLLVAFLLGYSVEIFTSQLDALIDHLRADSNKN